MLDYRDIRLLTPEEQAARTAELRSQQEIEYLRQLEALDRYELDCERGGRPPIVLPPEVAQRVLDDLKAGHSDRAIVRKYSNTPWAFSCRWLSDAKKDGRLHQMAAGRGFPLENLPEKANAHAPV